MQMNKRFLTIKAIVILSMAIALFAGCARSYGDTDEFRAFKRDALTAESTNKTEFAQNYTYNLDKGVLTFSDSDGKILWKSDKYWFVEDFKLADVDRDGSVDCLFSLWKSYSFGREFAEDNDDAAVRNHLFLYTIRGGYGKQLWCSSNLPRPIYSFELDNQTLTTIEGEYSDTEKTNKAQLTYEWRGWGFVEETRRVIKTAKISLAGDIMLHDNVLRKYRTGAVNYDFSGIFDGVKDLSRSRDLFIAGLEGVVDAYGGNEKISGYPRFNFPFEILDAVKLGGINFLVTANNHALDQGFAGVKSTRANLINAGIDFTGTYENEKQYNEYSIKEVNGIKIGIAAWTALDNGALSSMGDSAGFVMRAFDQETTGDVPRILRDVEAMRESGAQFVIIALHWGVEYADEPTETQREIARLLVESGVDVVYGSHTHCVQPVEIVEIETDGVKRKALIVYSAGNFFASQEVLDMPKTQRGIIVNFNVHDIEENAASLGEVSIVDTVCEGYEVRRG